MNLNIKLEFVKLLAAVMLCSVTGWGSSADGFNPETDQIRTNSVVENSIKVKLGQTIEVYEEDEDSVPIQVIFERTNEMYEEDEDNVPIKVKLE